jgi:hypothetical protein
MRKLANNLEDILSLAGFFFGVLIAGAVTALLWSLVFYAWKILLWT